jgi:hypothetical protein
VSYSGGESRWYTGKTDLVKTDLTNPKYLPFLLLPSLSLVRPLISFSSSDRFLLGEQDGGAFMVGEEEREGPTVWGCGEAGGMEKNQRAAAALARSSGTMLLRLFLVVGWSCRSKEVGGAGKENHGGSERGPSQRTRFVTVNLVLFRKSQTGWRMCCGRGAGWMRGLRRRWSRGGVQPWEAPSLLHLLSNYSPSCIF